MTHVTCRLTAKSRDQLQNPTLGNRAWATFYLFKSLYNTNRKSYLGSRLVLIPPACCSDRKCSKSPLASTDLAIRRRSYCPHASFVGLTLFYFASTEQRSILVSVFACLFFVCLSACLSIRISPELHIQFSQIFVHDCGSVVLWWRCDTVCSFRSRGCCRVCT